MPTVNTSYLVEDDEERARKAQQLSTGIGPIGVGTATGASIQAAPEGQRGQALGNMYGKFLGAQGGNIGFASEVARGQEREGQEFGKFAGERGAAFRGASEAGTQRFDPTFVSQTLAVPERLAPDVAARFQAARLGQYAGPESFEKYAGEEVVGRTAAALGRQDIGDAAVLGGSITRAGGGRGAGKQALNLALLGGTQQRAVLEEGRARLGETIGAETARTASEANRLAAENRATSLATGESVRGELEAARTRQGAENEATRRAAMARAAATQAEIKASLSSGQATPALLKQLKMTQAQWEAMTKDIQKVRAGFDTKYAGPGGSYKGVSYGPDVDPAAFKANYDAYNAGHIAKYGFGYEGHESRWGRTGEWEQQMETLRRVSQGANSRVTPAFNPETLYTPANVEDITTAQAMSKEQGARTEALARLAGEEESGTYYGGAPAPGAWDPEAAQRLQSIISRYR